jgi:hypothetical protein
MLSAVVGTCFILSIVVLMAHAVDAFRKPGASEIFLRARRTLKNFKAKMPSRWGSEHGGTSP